MNDDTMRNIQQAKARVPKIRMDNVEIAECLSAIIRAIEAIPDNTDTVADDMSVLEAWKI